MDRSGQLNHSVTCSYLPNAFISGCLPPLHGKQRCPLSQAGREPLGMRCAAREEAPVVPLSLYFSLGQAPCGTWPRTASWCPPESLCGSILSPAPVFGEKADPMPSLSCAAGGFLSLLFSRARGMRHFKVLFLPSPHPRPLLELHSMARAMYCR